MVHWTRIWNFYSLR